MEYSRVAVRYTEIVVPIRNGDMMSKSIVMLTLWAGLAAPLVSPGVVFAQNCTPTLADGSLNQCPPMGGGGHVDHRPDRLPHGGNDSHGNNGIHGTPSVHSTGGAATFNGDGAHSAGMGHGGGAGSGAGGGHGK
jgi:hypothetical protein